MKPPPDNAFKIVSPETNIHLEGATEEMRFQLLATPGHTHDHVSPFFTDNNGTSFVFTGESAGTFMHSTELITLGTSMPPDFNYSTYIKSLKKIIKLNPSIIGFGHFGAVFGREEADRILNENLKFSSFFRDFVREKFSEQNKTKFVVEEFIQKQLSKRVDPEQVDNPLLKNTIVALVYGQLVDLGLRDPK